MWSHRDWLLPQVDDRLRISEAAVLVLLEARQDLEVLDMPTADGDRMSPPDMVGSISI